MLTVTPFSAVECFVAGFRYGEGYEILESMSAGDPVTLNAEPGNPYDPCAVRVEHRRSRIGYVPRVLNQPVFTALQQGESVKARIVQFDPQRPGWEALRIEIASEVDPSPVSPD